MKNNSKAKLIIALDFPDIESAKNLVNQIGDSAIFYKIGLELLISGNYFDLVKWLSSKNKKIFADLKLFDIPNTVGKAVKNLANYDNIELLTIHSSSRDIMEEAANNKGNINLLAVTMLTSLNQNDLLDMNLDNSLRLEDLVLKRSKFAKECNIDGVISSGFETKMIKDHISDNFLVVNPGIRLNNQNNSDQKRVVDAKTAIENGADHIVVGRPISQSDNPKLETEKYIKEISESLQ